MAKVVFTAGRVSGFTCPAGKAQAFLWDVTAPGLALRATPAGKPAYVFQGRYQDKTIRLTIGSLEAWSIEQSRSKARELQRLIDEGQDPRELKRGALAATAAKQAAAAANAVTVGEAWSRYTKERRPHWGALTIRDHDLLAQVGGIQRERRPGVLTKAGPLAELMPLRLADLTAPVIEAWAGREAKDRPARVRSALRLLKAFLRWAASEPDLKGKADPTAASAKKTRELAGKAKPKNDYLQREQLPDWFTHVRQIQNPVISAYLQCLLLTGARREELAALKWEDVNFQWKGLDLKDKIEGRRAVPLTPFVAQLLAGLPKRNEWVFSSVLVLDPTQKNTERRARYHEAKGHAAPMGDVSTRSASGRLVDPSNAHRKACAAAGLVLTLHGLRRSFASLCEWLDIPGGISAQIQGHAPQGVREQNYIRRPLDLLRVHHEKIEAWILEQAGIVFEPKAEPGKLHLVVHAA
ncbi:integrase family protein [Polaromonas sp.]|uniref:tyrosine-type recombinase/integrase n=1 Tax=Polaromonas sp. TaxID=1869339 RepID=UPI0024875132|nr:integrase family protein [Polaromonas sp.]MDI1272337.1 integrase family protein [Polaromonas sp.]